MPQSLRSILGHSNRVRKANRNTGGQLNRSQRSASSASSSSSSPFRSPSSRKTAAERRAQQASRDEARGAGFDEKLCDLGTIKLLQESLVLRDVIQAMRFIRSRMFTPVPERGFGSARMAELAGYRAGVPPVITLSHLHAVLGSESPTRVEKEVVELWRKGALRKIRVERRGAAGEALIESGDFEAMVRECAGLAAEVRDRFIAFLRENPSAQTLPRGGAVAGGGGGGGGALSGAQTDQLVRAGFLTSPSRAAALEAGNTLYVRPEDKATLTSIHHVSRFASGSMSAVGGQNAIHLAGGGGGSPALMHRAPHPSSSLPSPSPPFSTGPSPSSSLEPYRISIPGHGRYLKLAQASVDWLRDALARTKFGEAPESWFRERLEGAVEGGRGLYGLRWRELWGIEWEWVLGEAVGLGVVEVFETGSVGRGVRGLA